MRLVLLSVFIYLGFLTIEAASASEVIRVKNDSELKDAITKLTNHSTLILAPGIYREKIVLEDKFNISILGSDEGVVVLDGGKSIPDITLLRADREDCNIGSTRGECEWSEDMEVDWIPQYQLNKHSMASLQVNRSENIRIAGITFKNSYPSHISLCDSKNLYLSKNSFYGGTFAIHAEGLNTKGIIIENNRWVQDESDENLLWSEIDWVHAHHGLYSYLNGAFFGSTNIAGNVLIRKNFIRDAFNAIRLNAKPELCKNKSCVNTINRDVTVTKNTFIRIRDNVIEPEKLANGKWIISENQIIDAHADISLDNVHNPDGNGMFILYKNSITKKTRPSMGRIVDSDLDLFNGGKIFKLPKKKLNIYLSSGKVVKAIPYLNLVLQENKFDLFREDHQHLSSLLKGTLPRGTNIENWGDNSLRGDCRMSLRGSDFSDSFICDCLVQRPDVVHRPPVLVD